ncbi:LOW QUALITY PROTEIN: hypothetical protein OSB04_017068 [Centaurea solstitialis]|uniref:Uncharacterized protein n=1 Tax=Centaurea solstitialis TaxID=347529 RepID=A0AA38T9U0_9ASTR|nr:LOW QUALITY PROTEIN: hypothetical protein OSB04_017068 [Centaurea solstitialis]
MAEAEPEPQAPELVKEANQIVDSSEMAKGNDDSSRMVHLKQHKVQKISIQQIIKKLRTLWRSNQVMMENNQMEIQANKSMIRNSQPTVEVHVDHPAIDVPESNSEAADTAQAAESNSETNEPKNPIVDES